MLKKGDEIMYIKMEDIPYNLHTMVEIIGIDKFIELLKIYGGSVIYIPVYKRIILPERNRKIIKEYNGKNVDLLRQKYNLSNAQIKNVIKNN